MWILYAVIVHLALLYSIFVIYFRSPVIPDLIPQREIPDPPASRLVLIVTDGLRSESFFRDNCSDVSNIRDMMINIGGIVGVSHTRVPTETRPGHIALLAGLYEDPSAVFSGWKNNPTDFDTLFHRSSKAFAFGSFDVLHLFANLADIDGKLVIEAYNDDLDFSGRNTTYKQDEWVFDHVNRFLIRKSADLIDSKQVIFFLHLLGLDTAGHVHKPGSTLFLENLHSTDAGIRNIYEMFERVFNDGRTAYLLTSDHGMSNAGSHGAGDPLETDTPFYLWGAGIHSKPGDSEEGKKFQAEDTWLPLYEVEQAQLTPLMSALLGLPPPTNNFGIMPHGYLDVTREYEKIAEHNNAMQLLEQYNRLLQNHQKGYFSSYLPHFRKLNATLINNFTNKTMLLFKNADELHKNTENTKMLPPSISEDYRKKREDNYLYSASATFIVTKAKDEELIARHELMKAALEGIDYYHNYYREVLLISTTLTFIGWICYLLQLMQKNDFLYNENMSQTHCQIMMKRRIIMILWILTALVLAFLLFQNVTVDIFIYIMLPFGVYIFLFNQHDETAFVSRRFNKYKIYSLLLVTLCAELLVLAFFERKIISLVFFIYSAICGHYHRPYNRKFWTWLALHVIILFVPFFSPSIGNNDPMLLAVGIVLIFLRKFCTNKTASWEIYTVCGFVSANSLLCAYQYIHKIDMIFWQGISWCSLFGVLAMIFLKRIRNLKKRVELIVPLLFSLYALLTTSYELIYIVLLSSELITAIQRKESIPYVERTDRTNFFIIVHKSYRQSLGIMIYTFLSFFGTGNIASISSFDPTVGRCFIGIFAPTTIMCLVILKLVIPVLIIIVIIFGLNYNEMKHITEREIFISLMIICDIMGLNFLFLVRNTGSWKEIGMSISHFVIMEVTTVVLFLLTFVAKLFLKLKSNQNRVQYHHSIQLSTRL